jgi:hypothetical protein
MTESAVGPYRLQDLMPDEKDIVYTVNRPRQEIWILSGLQSPPPWYLRLVGR